MNVLANVEYGLRVKRVDAQGAPCAAPRRRWRRSGSSGYGDRRPNQLSGGQRQRVALARALVNRPKVLLLDEPLGALDLKLRREMQMELKQIQRDVGITFVFVTHDQEEALTMSDRIAVFRDGPGRAGGHAGRALRAARQRLRRRLRRHLEPDRRRGGRERCSAQAGTFSVRPEKMRIADAAGRRSERARPAPHGNGPRGRLPRPHAPTRSSSSTPARGSPSSRQNTGSSSAHARRLRAEPVAARAGNATPVIALSRPDTQQTEETA